jgi:hypothetical protein
VSVLGKDQDAVVLVRIGLGAFFANIYPQCLNRAIFDTGPAKRAGFVHHGTVALDADSSKGATRFTDTASRTFLTIDYQHKKNSGCSGERINE